MQLRVCAPSTEPACSRPVLCNKRSHCNAKPVYRQQESSPCSPQLQKPVRTRKTQDSHQLKKKKVVRRFSGPAIFMILQPVEEAQGPNLPVGCRCYQGLRGRR